MCHLVGISLNCYLPGAKGTISYWFLQGTEALVPVKLRWVENCVTDPSMISMEFIPHRMAPDSKP